MLQLMQKTEGISMRLIILLAGILLIQGCSAHSHFSAVQDDVNLTIGKTDISGALPLEGDIPRTTFGRYPVKVTREGSEPLYFNLPLKVSGGMIVVDAIFFAPAAFFNVQGSIPLYEIDMDQQVVRYKQKESDEWREYFIQSDQIVAAKSFFGDH